MLAWRFGEPGRQATLFWKLAGGELPAPGRTPGSDHKESYHGIEGSQTGRRFAQEPQARGSRQRVGHRQDRRSRHERPEVPCGRRQGPGLRGWPDAARAPSPEAAGFHEHQPRGVPAGQREAPGGEVRGGRRGRRREPEGQGHHQACRRLGEGAGRRRDHQGPDGQSR